MLLVGAPAAAAQQLPNADINGYCAEENTQFDPQDLERPDAEPVGLPPGFTRRRVELAGHETAIIEGGPATAEEAVVFLHGLPGSSLDFAGLLRSVPVGTRVVAFDLLGFGEADDPYDHPYDLASGRVALDRSLERLGIERLHLVAHDLGGVLGVDYAARHPERVESAVLIAGGILIGYVEHHFARISKTPFLGEESMRRTDRRSFYTIFQLHNPRPLPAEFVHRTYDNYDRATRCAILKIYRGAPDANLLGLEHARALASHDVPALVIWGDRDPFLPAYLAYGNRLGFPSADIHIFHNSGHWPFVDAEGRTVRLMSDFFAHQIGAG